MTVTNCAFNPVIIVSNIIYWSQKASINVAEDDINHVIKLSSLLQKSSLSAQNPDVSVDLVINICYRCMSYHRYSRSISCNLISPCRICKSLMLSR